MSPDRKFYYELTGIGGRLAYYWDLGSLQLSAYRYLRKWEQGALYYGVLGHLVEWVVTHLLDCYLPAGAEIGSPCVIFHGKGLIINGNAVIGKKCVLYSRICIGSRFPKDVSPVLGDNVTVGTGACILGPVKIPDNTVIPANAVVTPKNIHEFINET